MPTALVKLVAILLLCVQAVVGMVPGQVLCIQVADCGLHDDPGQDDCCHCSDSCCDAEDELDGRRDHDGQTLPMVNLPAGDCGCHIHVRIPAAKQVVSRARGELPEASKLFGPMLPVLMVGLERELPRMVFAQPHPPNPGATDRALCLRSTRLLI